MVYPYTLNCFGENTCDAPYTWHLKAVMSVGFYLFCHHLLILFAIYFLFISSIITYMIIDSQKKLQKLQISFLRSINSTSTSKLSSKTHKIIYSNSRNSWKKNGFSLDEGKKDRVRLEFYWKFDLWALKKSHRRSSEQRLREKRWKQP